MSQTIRPWILLTINRKSTGSIDELSIICQGSLYMHFTLASAGLPCKFKRLKSRFEWQVYNVDELLQHIQTVWDELDQRIIDKAIKQWRPA